MPEKIVQVRSALISVFYKTGLDRLAQSLTARGVKIYSTGGTEKYLRDLGIDVTSVESLTEYPAILGGRVKTLHPKIFGGILARRDNKTDNEETITFGIPPFDLVVVDLYPFEETLAKTANEEEIIEKIDIGGVALLRAAAKNFSDVLVCSSPKDYESLIALLEKNNGAYSLKERKFYAAKAFAETSRYDTEIVSWMNQSAQLMIFRRAIDEAQVLRYGENPHQVGVFFGNLKDSFTQLHGKEISYNNLVDVASAKNLIGDLPSCSAVVIKHTNACGAASATSLAEAWKKALAGDPVSAFGGVIAVNEKVDAATAAAMDEIFFEVLLAPAFDEEALQILKKKKNRILLETKNTKPEGWQFKSLLGGVLMQQTDSGDQTFSDWKPVTEKPFPEELKADARFANILVQHLKSNAITLVKNQQLIGSGCGQTSRIDALKQAIAKATAMGFVVKGCVMASDAFFPFPDCVEISAAAGVVAIVQPGGSVRDEDSVRAANELGIAMVTTGQRHFLH